MSKTRWLLWLGASAVALTSSLPGIAQADEGEIVVTAQRRSENIQNVPVTVTAVTDQQVKDLRIFRIEDVQSLSPGLALESQGAFGAKAQLRGVGFDADSSGSPAVDIYYNETPVDANYAFQAIYDVGQIEVLRGPQGTLRGRPSPAGAVTLTSRRPDLQRYTASASVSGSDQKAVNAEIVGNIPIIKDQLAVRIAGVYNKDEIDGLESVNGAGRENRKTNSYRGSLRWTPTQALDVNFAYQHLQTKQHNLVQVEGDGLMTIGAPPAFPFGPAISGGDRLAVQEGRNSINQDSDIYTLNVAYEFGKARVVYNGALQDNSFDALVDLDAMNAVSNYTQDQVTVSKYKVNTQEIRLESMEPVANFDYTLGLWYQKEKTNSVSGQGNPLFGAFGFSPVGPVDPAYDLQSLALIPTNDTNTAIYGNLTYHFTDRTSLSVGARRLKQEIDRSDTIITSAATVSFPLAFPCFFAGATDSIKFGPGFCDIGIPADPGTLRNTRKDYNEWVYQASLKHNFTDDFMGYVSYGHSWRPPGQSVAIFGPISQDLIFAADKAEESDSYEVGVRSEWFDKRLRVNGSYFHQDFTNYIGRFNDVPYTQAGGASLGAAGFTYPGDAVVNGVELEVNYDVSDNWTVNLSTAWADGHFDNARVPCRDTDKNGVPDGGDIGLLTPGDMTADGVMYCVISDSIATTPDWQATLQSEYNFPLFGNEGYVRGLYNYQPENRNAQAGFTRESYGLLNLYAGIRSNDRNWEIGLWAKNALDEEVLLTSKAAQTAYSLFTPGYQQVTYTPEREIGLTMRYSFGE